MLKDKVIKSVRTLPPLNENIQKIYSICSDENSSLKDLSLVVEKDSMLTANILKSANSPLYGFSREITDVSRAINLFGMATIKGFAIASAAKNSFKLNLEAYGISEGDFLNISTASNNIAAAWLKGCPKEVVNVVVPASFLLEIGKVVIASELYAHNMHKQFYEKLKTINNIDDIKDLEIEVVGISNEEVAANIFDNWKLDSELVDSILYSQDPQKAPEHLQNGCKYLHVIKHLANIFGIFKDCDKAISLCEQYNLNSKTLKDVITKQKDNLS